MDMTMVHFTEAIELLCEEWITAEAIDEQVQHRSDHTVYITEVMELPWEEQVTGELRVSILFQRNLISWLEQEEELRTVERRVFQESEMHLKTKDSAVPPQDILGEKTSNRIETERSHNGWELCECKECGKDFSEQLRLKMHRRTHYGGNTYEDNQCGKSFLILHKKSSTREEISVFNQWRKAIGLTPNIVSGKLACMRKPLNAVTVGKPLLISLTFRHK
ncbi:PREDICTED: zinc finger protein 426-like [Ceratotherium simum simum]|uniref:Zinc finger protein 426-like n=1 Tax=Ceratotherium simum simum TaxID=73337 RepID=A0ABM1DKR4_CERSS|nr:PREDICTED: zinc finger protein 426-like [Ceratotherium simum simum]